MARLIEYNKKRLEGEEHFWNLINGEPYFDDWTVIWGLAISEHQKKQEGQSDFVLIGPLGILIIEIKGGTKHIFRENGGFEWGSDSRSLMHSKETPFQQASGNKYAIRKFLQENFKYPSKIQKTIFAHGAAFPFGDLTSIKKKTNIQFQQWQIWDSNSTDIKTYIVNLIDKTTDTLYEILDHYEGPENLSQQDITFILQYLAIEGKAIFKVSKEKEIESELIRLQDDQCKIYEQNYKKICVDGGPGTGKSIGAEYIANQLILDQKKILWISFNRLFTESIAKKFTGNGFIDVKKSTQMMLDICRSNGLKLSMDDPELMNKFAESALELSLDDELVKYDAIIIDEAQDILTEGFYEGLDFLIKGGWKSGSWYVFLDSDIQAEVLNRMDEAILKQIQGLADLKATFSINYRNSPDVISDAAHFAEIPVPECKSKLEGSVTYLENREHKKNFVEEKVHEIISSGVRNPVVLTYQNPDNFLTKSVNNSFMKSLGRPKDQYYFSEYGTSDNYDLYAVKFANIVAYKGLENNDIILHWPLKYYDSHYRPDLYYTALSRAFNKVYVILDDYEADSILLS